MDEEGFTGKDGRSGSRAARDTGSAAKSDANTPETKPAPAGQQRSDPIDMLRADHRKVEGLFASFEKTSDAVQKSQLVEQICNELIIHTLLEEEIFYPACQGHMEERRLAEAQVEHDNAKLLIGELKTASSNDRYFDAKVKVLAELIKHHVSEEEAPKEGILAKAKAAGLNTAELGQHLSDRKAVLLHEATVEELDLPRTRSFRVMSGTGKRQSQLQENAMARQSTMVRERDEYGRFVSDDDRDYRRSRSRYDDDDDRRGRIHGGWYGDPAGHAEAARRGWDEREGMARGRYRDDDDDDRRRYSRANYRERDEYGRFVSDDDRDYRRSRSRYDDDDDRRGRGHGGWYGDPEGHSQASRRGWDDRR